MKYVVLFAVLAVIYLLWKHQRQQERADRAARPPAGAHRAGPAPGSSPQEMVCCAACDLHLPRADAVADAQGRLFCSATHRDKTNA